MNSESKLNEMLKVSMKERNKEKVSAIRNLKSALKYFQIEKKMEELDDGSFLEVVAKQVKQRKDSIAEFEKAGRDDLVAKEKYEYDFLIQFMPKQLSEEELEKEMISIIEKEGINGKKDFGKLMKLTINHFKNQTDGNQIKKIAQKLLS